MTEGKREAGANPARSRHCIRGAEATKFFFSHWETGKAVFCDDPQARKPAV